MTTILLRNNRTFYSLCIFGAPYWKKYAWSLKNR